MRKTLVVCGAIAVLSNSFSHGMRPLSPRGEDLQAQEMRVLLLQERGRADGQPVKVEVEAKDADKESVMIALGSGSDSEEEFCSHNACVPTKRMARMWRCRALAGWGLAGICLALVFLQRLFDSGSLEEMIEGPSFCSRCFGTCLYPD